MNWLDKEAAVSHHKISLDTAIYISEVWLVASETVSVGHAPCITCANSIHFHERLLVLSVLYVYGGPSHYLLLRLHVHFSAYELAFLRVVTTEGECVDSPMQ